MLQKLKRAFTITELVIVIALVAILAAVLIPTFANVVKNANESADTQTVKHLNTIIASEQTISREPAANMTQVLEQAEEGGYVVEKLTPVSDGDIVWEQTSNRFALISSDGKMLYKEDATPDLTDENAYQFWKIVRSDSEVNNNERGYSCYLADGFPAASVNAVSGVDVGTNTGVSVSYTSDKEQSVTFRTSGGSLSVNAPNADVSHYGLADNVTLVAVAMNSYHLYGTVTNSLTVNQGRVYLESTASVNIVEAAPSANAATDSIVIDGSSEAEIGNITITLNSTSTTSVSVSDSMESYVTENTYVEGADATLTEIGQQYFSGGMGTKNSPFLITNEEDLTNVNVLAAVQESTSYYFRQENDITLSTKHWFSDGEAQSLEFSGIYDGNGHKLTVGDNPSSVDLFAVFTITSGATIKNLDLYSANDCLMAACQIGGAAQNVLIDNVDCYSIDNDMISVKTSNAGFIVAGHIYTSRDLDLTIQNCDINANITNSGTCTGVFIGGSIYWRYDAATGGFGRDYWLTISDCTYSGTVFGSDQAGLIFGNFAGSTFYIDDEWTVDEAYQYITEHCTLSNVKNNGVISSSRYGGTMFGGSLDSHEIISRLHAHYASAVGGTFRKGENVLQDVTPQVYYGSNGFVLDASGLPIGYTYELQITVSIATSASDGYDGRGISISLPAVSNAAGSGMEISAGGVYLEKDLREKGILTEEDTIEYSYMFEASFMVGIFVDDNGTVYMVLQDPADGEYPKPKSAAMAISLSAFDSTGAFAGQKQVDRFTPAV